MKLSKHFILTASLACAAMLLAGEACSGPLERGLPQDERTRLHRELDEYSNRAYPDHEKLEQRRRAMREHFQQRLQRADQNGNGTISRSEAEQHMPRLARHFDRIDTNGDGELSREELRLAHEKRHARP